MMAQYGLVESGDIKGAVMKMTWPRPATQFTLSLVVFCTLGLTTRPEAGKPTGFVTFYGSGETQKHAPDMLVWKGAFYGQGVTDSGKGLFHYSAWDCTGEMAYQSQKVSFGGGFCAVTDRDGDKVNLRWEVDEPGASAAKVKTKGTYLSGSGKYSGIQGGYNFLCELIADTTHYICRIVGGEYTAP